MCLQDSQGGSESAPADTKVGKSGKMAAGKAGSKAAGGAAASKADKAAEQQRQAQLELLMLDDSALQDVARVGGFRTFCCPILILQCSSAETHTKHRVAIAITVLAMQWLLP